MPGSKYGQYFKKALLKDNMIGDLARYVNENNPALFAAPADQWDSYIKNSSMPVYLKEQYARIRRMLTAKSKTRIERDPFAAYMWRYRQYTGPTAELARTLYDSSPELFTRPFDDWLKHMQDNGYPDDMIDQLCLAHRRSLRNSSDPDYARYINKRYTQQHNDSQASQHDDSLHNK